MSIEDPHSENEGSRIETERQLEIAAEEANLGEKNKEISHLLDEARGRDVDDSAIRSITARFEVLTNEINDKFLSRLISWPRAAVAGATLGSVSLMGTVGGAEGMINALGVGLKFGAGAATVVSALWGLALIGAQIKEWREKSKVKN